MKKLKEKQKTILSVSLVLLLTLCAFIIFWVGSHRTVQFEYLGHVDENGFSAYHDGELIYFHYPNASEEFRPHCLVGLEYDRGDLYLFRCRYGSRDDCHSAGRKIFGPTHHPLAGGALVRLKLPIYHSKILERTKIPEA